MLRTILAGVLAGLVIVAGEVALNVWLLAGQWAIANNALGLHPPTMLVTAGALGKLFLLGFVLVWLYLALREKYGRGAGTGAIAGVFVASLLSVWAVSGLLLAGYVNGPIAVSTMLWGLIELPVAGALVAKVIERARTSDIGK